MPVGRQAKHAEEVRKVRKGNFKQAKVAKGCSCISFFIATGYCQ